MDLRKERELEQLVSSICDDGASAQSLRALEALLVDDPELQDRYRQFMSTHIALGVAVSCDADKSLPRALLIPQDKQSPAFPSRRSSMQGDSQLRFFYYAAAILLFGLGIGLWTRLGHDLPVAVNSGSVDQAINWTVDRIPTITSVSWNGPTFSNDDDQWQHIDGTEAGPVSLQVKQGPSANGYLFCLPPGAAVELIATFHATGENCLSIEELVSDDRRPMRKATFNNCGFGPRPLDANPAATNRRFGVLGRWFERNAGSSPRYFLLTGSHKLAKPKPDQDWQLSEMAPILESGGVIHIGWDDSGPAPAEEGKAYQPDDDFDDLAATLIMSSPGSRASSNQSLLFIGENRGNVEGALPPPKDAWRITLAPGEMAILKATAWARAPNAVFLVDANTGTTYWASSSRNTNPSHESTNALDLGAAAIRNNSSVPQELLLMAMHSRLDNDGQTALEWHESQRKILFEQPDYVIQGYEDGGQDNDFDDLQVSVLRVDATQLPSASGDNTASHIH